MTSIPSSVLKRLAEKFEKAQREEAENVQNSPV
jgi:hypothetical protein